MITKLNFEKLNKTTSKQAISAPRKIQKTQCRPTEFYRPKFRHFVLKKTCIIRVKKCLLP